MDDNSNAPPAQAATQGEALTEEQVGQLVYRGSTVAHIYGRVRAHGRALMDAWAGLREAGYKGNAALPDAIREALAGAPAQQPVAWHAMAYAPLDGTEVELLIRHSMWWTATKSDDHDIYEGVVRAKWLDFNGGGWTWEGMAGVPVGWRPAATQPQEKGNAP